MPRYEFKPLEEKWRRYWYDRRVYRTLDTPREKHYCLVMFAYPSGDIHMGHFRNYTIGDVAARYRMMAGFDILHPFGWDAFGQPAEGAAIKHGIHPREWTMRNIEAGRATLKKMAIAYDWEREVVTCNPDYYKWTQWIFLKLLEQGLAYQGPAMVNWCGKCETILADEQAQGGKCWRCESDVIKKWLENCWFFRYSRFAERLLKDTDGLTGWPESVRTMQKNWIGRSEGCEIGFAIEGSNETLKVFTTRPDTLCGVTFIAIAPEHPLAATLAKGTPREKAVAEYVQKALFKSEAERSAASEKTGVDTGRVAIHPVTGAKVALYVGDYVLSGYGTGVVMGVPAHDQRDFEFAGKHGLEIRAVIQPKDRRLDPKTMTEAYTEPGVMANSGPFDGTDSVEGIRQVSEWCAAKKIGGPKVTYRLRDWLISRQRYWGCPIPIVHCGKCGAVPVPEKDLPVLLPEDVKNFVPKGRSPLADSRAFMETRCPTCGREATRDADTMDTFMDSSFYLFRYCDPKNDKEPWSREEVKKWTPVDLYIGGVEHACGHLLYFRFLTKVLHDAGWLPCDEPVVRLFNHGMVLDAKGEIMSKSKGNVVSPAEILDVDGVDVCRIAMLSVGPSDAEIRWSETGLTGARRFVQRVWEFVDGHAPFVVQKRRGEVAHGTLPPEWREIRRRMQQTIRHTTENMAGRMAFNTSLAKIQEFLNAVRKHEPLKPQDSAQGTALREILDDLVRLVAPMAPFLAEELWERLGNRPSVFRSGWPAFDPEVAKADQVEIAVQVNGKVRGRATVSAEAGEEEMKAAAMEAVKSHLSGAPRKAIVVPGRLVNFVG